MKVISGFITGLPLEAIGWTLLHSLWQSLLIAGIVATASFVLRRHSAVIRYSIAVAAMLFQVLLSFATFMYRLPHTQQKIHFEGGLSAPVYAGNVKLGLVAANTYTTVVNQHLDLIVMLWMLGVFVLAFRNIAGLFYIQRLRPAAIPLEGSEWRDKIKELSEKIGIRKWVSFAESNAVKAPITIGFFKPVILVPVGLLAGISPQEAEAILAHELAHIYRKDYLVNILQSFAEALFFFNPGFWWISSMLRKERENCCDDIALSVCDDSLSFLKALTTVEEFKASTPVLSMGFFGSQKALLSRVMRIVNKGKLIPRRFDGFSAILLLLFTVLFLSYSALAKAYQDIKPLLSNEKKDFVHMTEKGSTPPKGEKEKKENIQKPAPAPALRADSLTKEKPSSDSISVESASTDSAYDRAYRKAFMEYERQMKVYEGRMEEFEKTFKTYEERLNKALSDKGRAPIAPVVPLTPMPPIIIPPMPPIIIPPIPMITGHENMEEVERKIEEAQRKVEKLQERNEERARANEERIERIRERAERQREQMEDRLREARERRLEAEETRRARLEEAEEARATKRKDNDKRIKSLESELVKQLQKDDLIQSPSRFDFSMNSSDCYVNEKKLSPQMTEKYRALVNAVLGNGVKKMRYEKSKTGTSLSITD